MNQKNWFAEAPSNYGRCIQGHCAVAGNCIRHQLYLSRLSKEKYLCVLNPDQVSPEKGEACPYFQSDVPERLARGFSKALKTVPYGKVKVVQEELTAHYCRTLFYYYRKGERVLNAADQKYIADVLVKHGAQSPIEFDAYEEGYVWNVE